MYSESHISSLVVHCRPEAAESAATDISTMSGMHVHGGIEAGKLIVTLECETESEIVAHLDAIQRLNGVLATTLVFHHVEPNRLDNRTAGEMQPWKSHAARS
ncbi:chaperone NapD [Roseomonas terrae]|jgi:nitrate reductase NapD|uniref:Chaperone NapD n=1 Tax=Neoroseomonas terrae TaxID=424799 RepID=A0ABS5EC72_9PROT|nr:chaperone NapD [Neoroseomonas terrae]